MRLTLRKLIKFDALEFYYVYFVYYNLDVLQLRVENAEFLTLNKAIFLSNLFLCCGIQRWVSTDV